MWDPLRRGCRGQASFQLVPAPRRGQGEQGHVRGWASVFPRKMGASGGGLRGTLWGGGPAATAGWNRGGRGVCVTAGARRTRLQPQQWGSSHPQPRPAFHQKQGPRPLRTWMSGWGHRPHGAPPVSRPAGAGLWAPASLLEQSGTGPLPARTHLGADSGGQGPPASTGPAPTHPPPLPRSPWKEARPRAGGRGRPHLFQVSTAWQVLGQQGPEPQLRDPGPGTGHSCAAQRPGL